MVGAENGQGLARHVDSSPHERTVALWDLDCRCRELKCGFVGRDAERHVNEGSDRLMAKRPLPRQLVSEGFPNQEILLEKPRRSLPPASLGTLRSETLSPVPKDSRVLGKLSAPDE